jgi:hypothetical protein
MFFFELLAAKERKERKIELISLVGRVRLGIGMPSYVARHSNVATVGAAPQCGCESPFKG